MRLRFLTFISGTVVLSMCTAPARGQAPPRMEDARVAALRGYIGARLLAMHEHPLIITCDSAAQEIVTPTLLRRLRESYSIDSILVDLTCPDPRVRFSPGVQRSVVVIRKLRLIADSAYIEARIRTAAEEQHLETAVLAGRPPIRIVSLTLSDFLQEVPAWPRGGH